MNKFTKTEALPKTGHVNEVCKEWLVREDGALAYKLQSQEINHFYKGNRFRNGMVREDFPVALHEQIKEKENAEKQAEYYRKKLLEQEEYDKQVAKEIADKLERDLQEQQQRELRESEIIAQQMQEIYVNLPQPPPTAARDKSKPPPRPTKATLLQQNFNEINNQSSSSNNKQHHHSSSRHQHNVSSHNNNSANGYLHSSHHNGAASAHVLVSDEFSSVSPSPQQQSPFNQFVERSTKSGKQHPALTTDNFPMQQQQYQNAQQVMQQQLQRHKHSPSALPLSQSSTSSSSAGAAATRRNVFESLLSSNPSPALNPFNAPHSPRSSAFAPSLSPLFPSTPTASATHHHSHQQPPAPLPPTPSVEELVEYSDVADSIRRYNISPDSKDAPAKGMKAPTTPETAPSTQEQLHTNTTLTPTPTPTQTKTSSPSSSAHTNNFNHFNKVLSPSTENLLRADHKFQKLSPEKYDQIVGNEGAEGPLDRSEQQQHTDDIELYVDPCDYASLKEIGLPLDEIKEMSKKIKQEQKDELLARRLQEMESQDGLSQEERDRLLAIEAQDKELAKMLQEREKAKAKRAKEKARQRKSQHKESNSMSTSCSSISNGLHAGPLLPLPQDCMSLSKNLGCTSANNQSPHHPSVRLNLAVSTSRDELLDLEAYASPIDVINQQRLQQNGSTNGGSLSREQRLAECARDDDIYALPVDSFRSGQRPGSLNIGPETGHGSHNNSMTRSENYSLDSHDSLLSGHDVSPRMNYSASSKNGSFDHSSSPTPPYMPIQGTRRSNSSEERKKKSKDKCTHQ